MVEETNMQKWYKENKKEHLDKKNIKIICKTCGALLAKNNWARHQQSQSHKDMMKLKGAAFQGQGKRATDIRIINLKKILQNENAYKEDQHIYKVKGMTKLEKINSTEQNLEAKKKEMKKDGRILITNKKQLQELPLKTHVSYITKDGLYRSGGFLKLIEGPYFVLIGGSAARPVSWSVQFANIKEMWVKPSVAQQ